MKAHFSVTQGYQLLQREQARGADVPTLFSHPSTTIKNQFHKNAV